MYWFDTGNFETHWKNTTIERQLISFAEGELTVLPNTFYTFAGILLVPIAFLLFRLWLSLEFDLEV